MKGKVKGVAPRWWQVAQKGCNLFDINISQDFLFCFFFDCSSID